MHSNWKFFSDLSPEDQVKNGKFFGFFTKHSYPHELNSLKYNWNFMINMVMVPFSF